MDCLQTGMTTTMPSSRQQSRRPSWMVQQERGESKAGALKRMLILFQKSRTDFHQSTRVKGRRLWGFRQGWFILLLLLLLLVVLDQPWGCSCLAISTSWGTGLCQGLTRVFFFTSQWFPWKSFSVRAFNYFSIEAPWMWRTLKVALNDS